MSQPLAIRFDLPLPPSVNNQYITLKNGRRALSRSSRRWKQEARQEIELLRFDGRISEQFVATAGAGYLSLFCDFYFESPLRRDLDGGLKILQDTICQTLGVDDRRVVDIHLVKRIDPLRPHVTVLMEALPDWQFDDEYTSLLGDP